MASINGVQMAETHEHYEQEQEQDGEDDEHKMIIQTFNAFND